MSTIILRSMRTTSLFQQPHPRSQKFFKQEQLFFPSASLQPLLSQYRHVSTSTASSPGTSSAKVSKVNGPPTTLPAPLELPTKAPGQSTSGYLLKLGKTYLSFYKTGVKHIYRNFKLSRTIQHKIDHQYSSSLPSAVHANALTRSDFQLLVRNWHDVKRVPIFALVFLICGEFTPLVVLFLPGAVPWTCRIPKQIDKDRRKLEERRRTSFRNLTSPPSTLDVNSLNREQLLHISWSLGLSSSFWDYLGGRLPGLPTSILRRKVKNRMEYLQMDDKLIKGCGGVREMEPEEVRMALVERGVDVLGKRDSLLEADLGAWLKSKEKAPVERLLLARYII
jgi:hypothetical protein